jgi:hypothetical protein
METERNGGEPEPIDRRLQDPEIQRLHAEQERLRIEAERIWLEQERHFTEQARLRSEAESAEPHRYKAKIQQLIVQQPPLEPEKQSAEEENFGKTASMSGTPLSDDSSQPQRQAEIALEAPKQSVSSSVSSAEREDFSFSSASYAENHRTSWVLPVAALIFLLLGGTVLGVWFLQTPKVQESNQTNAVQTQAKQTETNQALSSSSPPSPEPTVRSTREITKVPPTGYGQKQPKEFEKRSTFEIREVPTPAISLRSAARPVEKPAPAAKSVAPRVKKPPRSRKTPPERKQSITIDDILNDQ